uniref:Uncharacterized protein n=1 Tax=Anguilla anguilla TaxID=7936 RepID=A0A0E9W985_ANGAN
MSYSSGRRLRELGKQLRQMPFTQCTLQYLTFQYLFKQTQTVLNIKYNTIDLCTHACYTQKN